MGAARKIKKKNNFDADLQIARSHTAVFSKKEKREGNQRKENHGISRSLSTCMVLKQIIYITHILRTDLVKHCLA